MTPIVARDKRSDTRAAMQTEFARALYHVMEMRAVTHRELARRMGKTSHSLFSQWKAGEVDPDRDDVFAVERALELPPGFLSVHLGYLPVDARAVSTPSETFEAVVEGDPTLDDRGKASLIASYRALSRPVTRERRRPQ